VCCIFCLASRHEAAFSNDIISKGSHAKAVIVFKDVLRKMAGIGITSIEQWFQ